MPDEPVIADVDGRRVARILRNLLVNAVEHGEGRPVEVALRGDGRAVAVTVRDHGVGLRPGEAALVFDRFWRADPSRDRRTGGTGLGLSISLEDARLHGGWLHAWGRPGHGAQFRLTLPVHSGDKVVSVAAADRAGRRHPAGRAAPRRRPGVAVVSRVRRHRRTAAGADRRGRRAARRHDRLRQHPQLVASAGHPQSVAASAPADDDDLRYDEIVPRAGEAPEDIVRDFLRASGSFERSHARARAYLTAHAPTRPGRTSTARRSSRTRRT